MEKREYWSENTIDRLGDNDVFVFGSNLVLSYY